MGGVCDGNEVSGACIQGDLRCVKGQYIVARCNERRIGNNGGKKFSYHSKFLKTQYIGTSPDLSNSRAITSTPVFPVQLFLPEFWVRHYHRHGMCISGYSDKEDICHEYPRGISDSH